jgi:hypothetical protein
VMLTSMILVSASGLFREKVKFDVAGDVPLAVTPAYNEAEEIVIVSTSLPPVHPKKQGA